MLSNNSRHKSLNLRSRARVAAFGLIAGLVSSIAISGLMLMVEKVTSVPIGAFYLVLMSAITHSQVYSLNMIVSGLLLHLVAGSLIGLAMAVPFIVNNDNNKGRNSLGTIIIKYAPLYGLGFGFALWSLLFIPITFWIVLPSLNTLEHRTIIQEAPTGTVAAIAPGDLLAMQNRIIGGALVFNMFYGLLVAIIIKSLYSDYLRKKVPLRDTITPSS
jgi:hypothetical protein